MKRLTARSIYLAAALLTTLPVAAQAQGRDGALSAVQTLTGQLIERINNGTANDRDVWVGVQALTEALHRFVLAETEIRAGEKVAPPALSSLRPGQSEVPASTIPGPESSLANVPTPWFNLQATHARNSLDSVRAGVEQQIPLPQLVKRLQGVQSALSFVNRPPA